jgi:transcriptional regulator with XRE-family HTH domain
VTARRTGLARARRAAGYTQEQLAELLHIDRATVVRWEAGATEPLPYIRPRLGRLLHVSREQLEALLLEGASPAQGVDRAAGAALRLASSNLASRSPVHAELLSTYETLTDTYRQLDYQAGAQSVQAETQTHLNRLLAAADQVPSALYRRFILGLGDVAQLAAWLAIDSQDYAAGRQYCALSLSCAEEGEDPNLHSYILGVMSYIHLHAGRGSEALRLLEAALRIADNPKFGVDPAVRSWLYEAMGEAYACVGNRAAGAEALARAEQLFDTVTTDTVPRWLGFFNAEAHVVRLKGRCLVRLGDGAAAISILETACKLLPEHYVRERSGTLIDLAAAHLLEVNSHNNATEPEAAASIAERAFQLAQTTQSTRNQRRVRDLLPQFAPYRRLDDVQALVHMVR